MFTPELPKRLPRLPGPQQYVIIMAFMAIIMGLGLLFYMLEVFRYCLGLPRFWDGDLGIEGLGLVILGLYWGYIGIMENEMETTI